MSQPSLNTPRGRIVGIALGVLALTAAAASAQTVDPDPEIFDGTRTKKDQIQQDAAKTADKWEDANLILYDSDEQGSSEGGQGRAGYDTPGYADGGGQGGVTVQAGLPMPMMGGGAGQGQEGAPQMPGIGAEGIPPGQQGQPGQAGNPSSGESTPTPSGQGMAQGQSGKPGDVSIGDPSQQISKSAQPVNKVQGGVPPPSTGEEIQPSKGEDTTTVPNSASGQQSQQRGGGVEKGDAMPTDI